MSFTPEEAADEVAAAAAVAADEVRERAASDEHTVAAADAEHAKAWENVNASDPVAVSRALAEVGMLAGARFAKLDHMHDRIGRALQKLDEATEALRDLVPRAEMEATVADLQRTMAAQRAEDRNEDRRRRLAWAAVAAIFLSIIGSAIVVNRAAIDRSNEEREETRLRTEAVAICASTYPGDEAKIHACMEQRIGE